MQELKRADLAVDHLLKGSIMDQDKDREPGTNRISEDELFQNTELLKQMGSVAFVGGRSGQVTGKQNQALRKKKTE